MKLGKFCELGGHLSLSLLVLDYRPWFLHELHLTLESGVGVGGWIGKMLSMLPFKEKKKK